MKVGDKFSSYEQMENCIRAYEGKHFIQLYKRDCRTLESMSICLPKKCKDANPKLKYYSVVYSCSKGGRHFRSKSKGVRSCGTMKNNCEMKIKLRLSDDTNFLVIDEMTEEHNHPLVAIEQVLGKTFQAVEHSNTEENIYRSVYFSFKGQTR